MTDTMTQTLHSQLDLPLMSPELSVALAKSSVLLSSLLILGPGHPSHRPWTHGCQLPQKEPSALPLPPALYYVLKPEPRAWAHSGLAAAPPPVIMSSGQNRHADRSSQDQLLSDRFPAGKSAIVLLKTS